MKVLLSFIIARWKEVGWITPLPTLDRHIEHIAVGALTVLFFLAIGASWFIAALTAALLFAFIEIPTGLWKNNWRDSMFDLLQYQFHWVLFLAYNSWWILAAVYLVVWLAAYVYMLLEGW